jgi:hypothetical protein
MKFKLIFIYSVVIIYLVSLGLTHLNENFIHLSMISMGFIWGFMANECFFDRKDSKDLDYWVFPNPKWVYTKPKFAITEGDTLSNIKTDRNRQVPIDPPPFLCKKEENMNKETIRVSFTFDVEGELDEELEFLHAKARHSRIKKLIEDYIREKIKDPSNNPDFLKDMKVNFSIPHSRTREQIISSMCFTYRHDYGIMTEEERVSLWSRMAQIFDNSVAPYVDLKHFGKQRMEVYEMLKDYVKDENNFKIGHPPKIDDGN